MKFFIVNIKKDRTFLGSTVFVLSRMARVIYVVTWFIIKKSSTLIGQCVQETVTDFDRVMIKCRSRLIVYVWATVALAFNWMKLAVTAARRFAISVTLTTLSEAGDLMAFYACYLCLTTITMVMMIRYEIVPFLYTRAELSCKRFAQVTDIMSRMIMQYFVRLEMRVKRAWYDNGYLGADHRYRKREELNKLIVTEVRRALRGKHRKLLVRMIRLFVFTVRFGLPMLVAYQIDLRMLIHGSYCFYLPVTS